MDFLTSVGELPKWLNTIAAQGLLGTLLSIALVIIFLCCRIILRQQKECAAQISILYKERIEDGRQMLADMNNGNREMLNSFGVLVDLMKERTAVLSSISQGVSENSRDIQEIKHHIAAEHRS